MTQKEWPKLKTESQSSLADKEGGMVGEKMGKVYDNYFENQDILKYFDFALDDIQELELKPNDTILEIGANAGIVGESVSKYILNKGIQANLIISDINLEAVRDNENSDTSKIILDNKNIPIRSGSIKLALARSVTHYEATQEQEKVVIKEIKEILSKGGFFIDQALTASTNEEADLWRDIHLLVDKPMNIQTQGEVKEMLQETFDNVDLAKRQPPSLHADHNGFIERYKSENKKEVIEKVQKLIQQIDVGKRPHIKITKNGFEWDVPFTIFVCKK